MMLGHLNTFVAVQLRTLNIEHFWRIMNQTHTKSTIRLDVPRCVF